MVKDHSDSKSKPIAMSYSFQLCQVRSGQVRVFNVHILSKLL